MTPAIEPLPKPEWPTEIAAFIAGYRSAVVAGNPEERQSGDNLLGTLARHPDLAQAFLSYNRHLLTGSTLAPRQRELLILRVAHLRGCDYEWAQHVILAQRAGLRPDEIDRVAAGPTGGWPAADRALVQAVDDLVTWGTVAPDTMAALAQDLDTRQRMDVVFMVCTYEMLAKALHAFGVEPEPALTPHLPTRAG